MVESSVKTYNHLKVHTQYSICEGAIKIDDLQDFSKSNKIQSLGLCDTSNLCGALEFAEKISKVGTQPIIGTQINFKYGDTIGLLPLYSLNEEGYKRIIKLSSRSFLENDELYDPHVNFSELLEDNIGVATVIEANHMCACVRGVKHDATMKTAKLSGEFMNYKSNSRDEFYNFIKEL